MDFLNLDEKIENRIRLKINNLLNSKEVNLKIDEFCDYIAEKIVDELTTEKTK